MARSSGTGRLFPSPELHPIAVVASEIEGIRSSVRLTPVRVPGAWMLEDAAGPVHWPDYDKLFAAA